MKNKKSEARKEFDKANGKTEFVIIKLSSLPDDCPVLAVSEFGHKSFAEFHLVDNVLVPKSAVKTIQQDLKNRATAINKTTKTPSPVKSI